MASFYDLLVSGTKDQFENKQFLNAKCFNNHRVIRLFWGHAILCPQKCPICTFDHTIIRATEPILMMYDMAISVSSPANELTALDQRPVPHRDTMHDVIV